jgi:hypothetical protein
MSLSEKLKLCSLRNARRDELRNVCVTLVYKGICTLYSTVHVWFTDESCKCHYVSLNHIKAELLTLPC